MSTSMHTKTTEDPDEDFIEPSPETDRLGEAIWGKDAEQSWDELREEHEDEEEEERHLTQYAQIILSARRARKHLEETLPGAAHPPNPGAK